MPFAWALSNIGLGLNGIWTAVLISHIVAAAAAAGANRELLKGERNLLSGEEL